MKNILYLIFNILDLIFYVIKEYFKTLFKEITIGWF